MKIVVFDLDETLGYFVEYGIFWDCLNKYFLKENYELTQNDFNEILDLFPEFLRPNIINILNYLKNKSPLTQSDFDNILDLYPEFLRPNIINILNYLKSKKQSFCCHKMMIYTNNQGPQKWAQQIISYFESKINYKLFDQIIAAFKVNGKKIEIFRTSHDKSYNDLIRCTQIPLDAEICFLDDNYFPEMTHKNVYYINIKPYYHDLRFETMIQRFLSSNLGKKLIMEKDDNNIKFMNLMMREFKKYNFFVKNKDENENEVDKILSKEILSHLQEFFNKSLKTKSRYNRTKKNNGNKRNKTMKIKN